MKDICIVSDTVYYHGAQHIAKSGVTSWSKHALLNDPLKKRKTQLVSFALMPDRSSVVGLDCQLTYDRLVWDFILNFPLVVNKTCVRGIETKLAALPWAFSKQSYFSVSVTIV